MRDTLKKTRKQRNATQSDWLLKPAQIALKVEENQRAQAAKTGENPQPPSKAEVERQAEVTDKLERVEAQCLQDAAASMAARKTLERTGIKARRSNTKLTKLL